MRASVAWFLALPLFFCACDRGGAWYGTTTPKHPADEFWISNGLEPEWIDPGKCSDNPGGTIIANTFEGLVQPNPHTLGPEPAVAKSWDISADKRTYTFHLRDDARWSDGKPVTAHDFVWSWTRVLDPATDSKYADQAFDIVNGEPLNQKALHVRGMAFDQKAIEAAFAPFGKVAKVVANPSAKFGGGGAFVYLPEESSRSKALAASWPAGVTVERTGGNVLGLEAPDDHTFIVTLVNPVSYFLPKITTLYTFYPVPRHVMERLISEGKNPDLWTRLENFVSNGPFVLKEWKFRQQMTFEQNPYYWDRRSIALHRVKLLEIESYTTTLQMYKAGEIDWIGENADIPSEYAEFLRSKKDYRTGIGSTSRIPR